MAMKSKVKILATTVTPSTYAVNLQRNAPKFPVAIQSLTTIWYS